MKKQKEPRPPTATPEQAITLIEERIAKGEELRVDGRVHPDKLRTWRIATHEAVVAAFGEGARQVSTFVASTNLVRTPHHHRRDLDDSPELDQYLASLRGFVDVLRTKARLGTPAPAAIVPAATTTPGKVFIVHGRDDGAKQTVARFLEQHLPREDVVILHEQANEGRTIIEKFEQHAAQVGFAVVLLTADDSGALSEDVDRATTLDDVKRTLKPRARQNVILELGFFLGKLGRSRVCSLMVGNLERPSDYDGVLYVPMDEQGAWRTRLGKELRKAGYLIDMNNVE